MFTYSLSAQGAYSLVVALCFLAFFFFKALVLVLYHWDGIIVLLLGARGLLLLLLLKRLIMTCLQEFCRTNSGAQCENRFSR